MLMLLIFLDSSMVEHSAVNRVVAGSSPARGVFLCPEKFGMVGKEENKYAYFGKAGTQRGVLFF